MEHPVESFCVDNKHLYGTLTTAFMRVSYIVERNSGVKILVIEDDGLTRLMLCKALRSKKYTTLEAPNGVLGLKMFLEQRPDVILTDILMPEKEGLQTILEIRAIDAKIPIIVMSGGGSAENINFLKMAGKLGATRTISKPFLPDDIISLMLNLDVETGYRLPDQTYPPY